MSAGTVNADVLVEAAAEAARPSERQEMPLPENASTVFLGGLFLLACLGALYIASEIVLAFVLNLLLQPVVRLLHRLRVPRALAAVLAVVLLVSVVGSLGMALSGPAATWAERLPEAVPRLRSQLTFLTHPMAAGERMLAQVQGTTVQTGPASGATPVRLANLFDTVFSGTRTLATGVFTTLLVLVYLLIFGELFLRRVVEILPRFGDKRRAVEITLRIESDLSSYLVTVTAINAVVGTATSGVMALCGMPDAVLWGFAAFMLNFVPILGPLVGVVLFALVGALALGIHWSAMLPASLYFLIHLVEGEVLTPLLLARRFTINPVALVLGLVFWYWMWGIPGAILAVPVLAITKIICDEIPSLRAAGHFLEG